MSLRIYNIIKFINIITNYLFNKNNIKNYNSFENKINGILYKNKIKITMIYYVHYRNDKDFFKYIFKRVMNLTLYF